MSLLLTTMSARIGINGVTETTIYRVAEKIPTMSRN